MPIYVYRTTCPENPCTFCHEGFELFQSMKESSVTNCPECGQAVVRLMYGATTIKNTSTANILSDDNLKKHGFKKLVNAGGGKFDEAL